jgi:hypothetical protein
METIHFFKERLGGIRVKSLCGVIGTQFKYYKMTDIITKVTCVKCNDILQKKLEKF